MHKRIISVFLALLMLLSLCACRRKAPAEVSQSFTETPAPIATVTPQATVPPVTKNTTPSPQPTLNWVESEDGKSMTATVPTEDGRTFQITLGVGESDTITDDESSNSSVSGPAASSTATPLPTPGTTTTPASTPTPAPVAPTTAPSIVSTPSPTVAPTVAPTTTPTAVPTTVPTAPPAVVSTPAPTTIPTSAPTTVPTAIPNQPVTNWTGPNLSTTYEEYEAMSGQAQLLFYYSFANANDFYDWYNAALAEHEANNGDIIIDLP